MKHAFTIPSDFAASHDVQLRIMQDVHDCGFNDETSFAIRISLEEAIVNAIRHGNRLDAKKKVYVSADVTPQRCEIVVEDEGPGFDRHHIPDPTATENLCRPSGRGILLIESYMTRVTWEHGGRRVRMVKDAAPVAPAAAS
jgi:serine/threonine-protein kinase RsbW